MMENPAQCSKCGSSKNSCQCGAGEEKPYCDGHRYLSHKNGDLPYYDPANCVQCDKEKTVL